MLKILAQSLIRKALKLIELKCALAGNMLHFFQKMCIICAFYFETIYV